MSTKTLTSPTSGRHFIVNGLALFSMFFGAGNVIFPLIIGQHLATNLPFALLGLFFTAILIPFSGVISTSLFEGDYYKFFKRTGNISGYIIILALFGLIGPFGGIPRLIGLSYSSIKVYFPNAGLIMFSSISCILLFLCTLRKNRIIDLLGYVLTPILLCSLTFVIIKGILAGYDGKSGLNLSAAKAFMYGLREGYNTMDLLASFFFASFIYKKVRHEEKTSQKSRARSLLLSMLKSSLVGAFCLTAVYAGFTYVSAMHTSTLSDIPRDQLLGRIGHLILGPQAGFVVSLVILMSCLTTAIALTVLCADFVRDQFHKKKTKPPYWLCLAAILAATFLISTLEFMGIVALLAPVLEIIYPSLLVLCLLNILYKVWGFSMIKLPFYLTLSAVAISTFLS